MGDVVQVNPDLGQSRPRTPSGITEVSKKSPLIALAMMIVPPLVAALVAYAGASGEAREKSQRVKDSAESGYQATDKQVAFLKGEVLRLEARLVRHDEDLSAIRRAIRQNAPRIRVAPPRPAVPPAAPPPAPMPRDLDKALEAVVPKP